MKRRRFITRRTCIVLMLLLVGGAIVNVAVAWAACIWPLHAAVASYLPANEEDFKPLRDAGWIQADTSWDHYGLRKDRYTSWGAEWNDCRENMGFRPPAPIVTMESQVSMHVEVGTTVRSGWPTCAVSGSVLHHRSVDVAAVPSESTHGLIMFPDPTRMLPWYPIWPGFAINTVFYAVILWAVFAGPFALRRRRRIKRGWCPKCAYDLRGRAPDSTVCPECGEGVVR